MAHLLGPIEFLRAANEAPTAKDTVTVSEVEIDHPYHFGTASEDDISIPSTLNPDFSATHLISSPYPDLANQLRLSDLSTPNQFFARALTILRPTRPDYATAPYLESFNWNEVFNLLRSLSGHADHHWTGETTFYVVIFRSKLQAGIDRERLGLLDQKSHEEACASGGLLKYWFGETDGERRNLATCEFFIIQHLVEGTADEVVVGLWRSHEDAVAGGSGPWHKQARAAAREMYVFERVQESVID